MGCLLFVLGVEVRWNRPCARFNFFLFFSKQTAMRSLFSGGRGISVMSRVQCTSTAVYYQYY